MTEHSKREKVIAGILLCGIILSAIILAGVTALTIVNNF